MLQENYKDKLKRLKKEYKETETKKKVYPKFGVFMLPKTRKHYKVIIVINNKYVHLGCYKSSTEGNNIYALAELNKNLFTGNTKTFRQTIQNMYSGII